MFLAFADAALALQLLDCLFSPFPRRQQSFSSRTSSLGDSDFGIFDAAHLFCLSTNVTKGFPNCRLRDSNTICVRAKFDTFGAFIQPVVRGFDLVLDMIIHFHGVESGLAVRLTVKTPAVPDFRWWYLLL